MSTLKLFVFILCLYSGQCTSRGTLKYLQILWRHGDRSAIDFIPSDQTNNVASWGDEGQLTSLGMWQHFQFGQWIRNKYVNQENFLSGNYSHNEIHVISTDYNRTIMSAMSNFAGYLYNSSIDYIPDANLPWVPMPVHTAEGDQDYTFDDICSARCHEFRSEEIKSDEWQQVESDNSDFFKFLADKMGISGTKLLDVIGVAYDALTCDMWHCNEAQCADLPHSDPGWNKNTHPWPQWVNKTVYDKVVDLHGWRNTHYYYNPKFQKYCIGFLLNRIVEDMLEKANALGRTDYRPHQKYFAFSAHDSTVQSVLTQLDIFNGIAPPFACGIIFELRQIDNEYHVELFYRNTTTNYMDPNPEYYPLSIPDCMDSTSCTLHEFYNYASSRMLTPDNYVQECYDSLPEITGSNDKNLFIAMAILAGVFGAAFLLSTGLYCTTGKNKVSNNQQMKPIN